jgi:uncharacterized MnhB-related membrane protein
MWAMRGRCFSHRGGQLAFHALRVVDVVLQEQVVGAHLVQDVRACAVRFR